MLQVSASSASAATHEPLAKYSLESDQLDSLRATLDDSEIEQLLETVIATAQTTRKSGVVSISSEQRRSEINVSVDESLSKEGLALSITELKLSDSKGDFFAQVAIDDAGFVEISIFDPNRGYGMTLYELETTGARSAAKFIRTAMPEARVAVGVPDSRPGTASRAQTGQWIDICFMYSWGPARSSSQGGTARALAIISDCTTAAILTVSVVLQSWSSASGSYVLRNSGSRQKYGTYNAKTVYEPCSGWPYKWWRSKITGSAVWVDGADSASNTLYGYINCG